MENSLVTIHTDASTKNGHSVSCSKIVGDSKCRVRVVNSNNSAAMELQAIISVLQTRALYMRRNKDKFLIITDSLSAVRIIAERGYYKKEVPVYFKNLPTTKEYDKYKQRFIALIRLYKNIEAQWVCSDNPCIHHQEVDQTAKSVLHEYLKIRGKA